MKVVFTKTAHKQLKYWHKTDRKVLMKIKQLIESIEESPFEGIGKPEALKHDLKGYWSRRITKEHRLVYKVEYDVLTIIACRFHY